jgi:hypothetical protein
MSRRRRSAATHARYRGRLEPDESAWPWLAVTSRNLLRDWERRGRADERARRRAGIAVISAGENDLEEALARLDSERRRGDIEAALAFLRCADQTSETR